MPTINDFMKGHHQDCAEIYASLEKAVAEKDWVTAERKAKRFKASMLQHFAMEEEVLFPAFEEVMGQGGPPAIMREEHGQMRDLLAAMDAALSVKDAASWLSAGDTLVIMMQQHNMKEEGILYPMTDQALAHEAGDIIGRMADLRDRA